MFLISRMSDWIESNLVVIISKALLSLAELYISISISDNLFHICMPVHDKGQSVCCTMILGVKWSDYIANEEIYGRLPRFTCKIVERRLNIAIGFKICKPLHGQRNKGTQNLHRYWFVKY